MTNRQEKIRRNLLDLRGSIPAAVRLQIFRRQCKRDAELSAKVSRQLGLKNLDCSATPEGAEGNTLFILAGGRTINDLSESDFATIRSNTSVGINFWPIHDFVPNILTSESDASEVANPFLDERLRRKEMVDQPPIVLSLRTNWPIPLNSLQVFPEELEKRRFVYGRANLVTKRTENLARDLSLTLRALMKGKIPPSVLPDNGSTVVRMSFWGALKGFSKIVWVGVDQDSGPYFWTDRPNNNHYRRAAEAVPRETGKPHSTSSSANRPFSNDVFLPALAKALRETTNTEVYVGSEKSLLSQNVPVYDWLAN